MDTDAVDSADVPVLTETPDRSHPCEDRTPFIEQFPSGLAGAPISDIMQSVPVSHRMHLARKTFGPRSGCSAIGISPNGQRVVVQVQRQ